MLHSSEWLDQARAVPVGQKRRVFHGAEGTAALNVYNNDDSWSAYCHRCHASGKMYKQFLQKKDTSVPIIRKYLDTKALVTLQELSKVHPEKYSAMVVLLHSKGVSTSLLRAYKPMYCLTDDRLVFRFQGVHIGRDCTGRSPMKWFKYHLDDTESFVYLQGDNTPSTREFIVLCEDLFSCIKITHYTGHNTMCLLGTRFEDAKVKFIIERGFTVLGAYDGDSGGDSGYMLASNRCVLLDIPIHRVVVPRNKDHKDLKPNVLIKIIEDAKHEN